MSLQVKALTKVYNEQKALDQISFEALEGQVLGFLGPNGAGKSTTMKIASGFLKPNSGDVIVNGISVLDNPKQVSKTVGYLPENNPLYQDMYVEEFLQFIGGLYQLKGSLLKKSVQLVIESCGLGNEKHKKIQQLSKGYRQRVGLAKALVHDPKVIILDEPTTGLDPNQLVEIRKLIQEISKDKTLILSTHIMQEVEAICEKVVIIHQGRIVAQDLLTNLKSDKGQYSLLLETEEKLEPGWFEDIKEIHQLNIEQANRLEFITSQPGQLRKSLLHLVQEKNLSLLSLQQREKDLESIFQQFTQS